MVANKWVQKGRFILHMAQADGMADLVRSHSDEFVPQKSATKFVFIKENVAGLFGFIVSDKVCLAQPVSERAVDVSERYPDVSGMPANHTFAAISNLREFHIGNVRPGFECALQRGDHIEPGYCLPIYRPVIATELKTRRTKSRNYAFFAWAYKAPREDAAAGALCVTAPFSAR